MLPAIGSDEFKRLAYKDQLEIISLELFSPEVYLERIGTPLARPDLPYPPNPDISIEDLPVAFLRDYWAGYSCAYNEDWYLSRMGGATPLDEYDIKVGYLVNVRTFTFPLLSLVRPLFYIISWVSKSFFKGEIDADTIMDACKVYNWLLHKSRRWDYLKHDEATRVYRAAMTEFKDMLLFDDLNVVYPTIEECDEQGYIENEEFVVYPTPQLLYDRAFYPLIPKDLYSTRRFSIKSWGFVDKVESPSRHNKVRNS